MCLQLTWIWTEITYQKLLEHCSYLIPQICIFLISNSLCDTNKSTMHLNENTLHEQMMLFKYYIKGTEKHAKFLPVSSLI